MAEMVILGICGGEKRARVKKVWLWTVRNRRERVFVLVVKRSDSAELSELAR